MAANDEEEEMKSSVISTTEAPAAIGPYSQAIRAGSFLYTSGQLGLDPATGNLAEGVEGQARRALENLKAILAAAGLSTADVIKTTIFLADMADFQAVNAIYASFFSGSYPARSTVQVAGLPKGGRVEIEAVALFRD
jgi:2-iminobutanoate/2-iminopropanoate deaminase